MQANYIQLINKLWTYVCFEDNHDYLYSSSNGNVYNVQYVYVHNFKS